MVGNGSLSKPWPPKRKTAPGKSHDPLCSLWPASPAIVYQLREGLHPISNDRHLSLLMHTFICESDLREQGGKAPRSLVCFTSRTEEQVGEGLKFQGRYQSVGIRSRPAPSL